MANHSWTYDENEFCVEQAFKSFVIEKEYDYQFAVTKLYIHFGSTIKKSSLKMKLQNIKYLFNKYNIPNTLCLSELSNASEDNEKAFIAICKKYSKFLMLKNL